MNVFTINNIFDVESYNYWIEVAGLFFLLILLIRFIVAKKFLSKVNVVFGAAIICGILNLSLDILGSILIDNPTLVSQEINELVNGSFYFFQLLFPLLLFFFIICIAGITPNTRKFFYLMAIPGLLYGLIILSNPLTHWIFSIDYSAIDGIFKHGPAFIAFYPLAGVYILLTFITLLVLKEKIEKNLFVSMIGSLIIVVLMVTLQVLFPNYLLIGFSISLCCWINYSNLSNAGEMIDKVTGIYNYNAFLNFLKGDINFAKRQYMIVINIDNLNEINSTFGIVTGNHVFKELGNFFSKINNKKVWAFRLFSSKFVLAFKDELLLKNALDQIETRFEESWDIENKEFELTAFGYYLNGNIHAKNASDFINYINVLETKIKSTPENAFVAIDQNYIEKLARAKIVENAIRNAINNNFKGFEMYYQPIYQISSNKFNHAEALIRFHNDELGNVSPGEFIPIAESCGLATKLDRFVLNTTCKFLKENPELEFLDINISGAEFFSNPSSEFYSIVKAIGIDPTKICFEVTETATVRYPEMLEQFMKDMSAAGFRFAIDDFGTGYSNISRVLSKSFNIVKLDKCFLSVDEKMGKILESMISLFHSLNMPIVIEGVETKEAYDHMNKLGVQYVQGFYFSKPLSEKDFIEFINK